MLHDSMDESFVESFGSTHDLIHLIFRRFLLGYEDLHLVGRNLRKAMGEIFPDGLELGVFIIEETHEFKEILVLLVTVLLVEFFEGGEGFVGRSG